MKISEFYTRLMKKNRSIFGLLILVGLIPFWSAAQSTRIIPTEISVTQAEKIGVIPPIRTLIPIGGTPSEKKKIVKGNHKAPNNFAGRGKYVSTVANAQPQGPDAIRQYGFNRTNGNRIVEPLVNIDGLTSGFSPNDPSGDIGTDHYMQAINLTTLGVFDKEGNFITSFTANTIWSSIGFSSRGDPIILFDQAVGRWLITEFPSGNQLLVAISDDSDPLGGYTAYNFATPSFPDYPKYSIWDNAYVVTTNENGPGTSPAYFIDREAILAGAATANIQRLTLPGANGGPGFQVDTPVDWSGLTAPQPGANPMILSLSDDAWGSSAVDQVDIYSFEIDFNNPNNTVTTVQNLVTSPFDTNPCSAAGPGFACMPQLGGTGIDGIPETIMNQAHYRNFGSHESMVFNFITDVTGGQNLSGIRWMEVRRSAGETEWSIYQEGTFAPDDGLDRFMGGIAMDGAGNIGLAYNVTSPDMYVGVRFTGRQASDPLGEMTVEEFTLVEGQNSISSNGRFGDYAHMSIDPVNDRTFWYTSEYANGGNGRVATRIAAFELRKDTVDIGPVALISPESNDGLTAAEPVEIEIKNLGLDTQFMFTVGYIFENGNAVSENVNFELVPDSTYRHTFASTVDMSEIGSYNFTLFTALADDDAILNDTIRAVVNHLPRYDAGITALPELPSFSCESPIDFQATLTNFGTVPLTSADIIVSLNGTVINTIAWTGNLDFSDSENVDLTLSGFISGENEILVTVANPSGEVDQEMSNDGRLSTFRFIEDGALITLNLNLDNFPEETTWTLVDDNDITLFAGGPYNNDGELISETWCLDPEGCYTFIIQDSYGDGICCGQSGNGNYEIVNADGLLLANSDGTFGSGEEMAFCATFTCTLTSEYLVSNETGVGGNGAFLISPANGTSPYEISIDGGITFSGSNIYQGLSAGEYNIVVQDANGCMVEETLIIQDCVIEILAIIENVSNGGTNDGSVTVTTNGGTPPFSYSIDGGNTFQDDPFFGNLEVGNYSITVRDGNECQSNTGFMIDMAVSTSSTVSGQIIEIMPNPTEGIFRINLTGLDRTSVFLPYQILTTEGKLVYESSITRYDNTYTGMISLEAYPDGVYYVRLMDKGINRLLQVIKQ